MDREEWDRALLLLQKAQVLIEQVNIENYKKDRLLIVIIFHNTALCHQMLGSLEEAAIFLETSVLNLEILSLMPEFQTTEVKNHTIYIEGLLRMQLWALFSQLHRHREALYHAQISVRISHFLVRDLLDYCESVRIQDFAYNTDSTKSKKELQQAGMSINHSKKIKIPGKDMIVNEIKESPKFIEDDIDEKSVNGGQSGYISVLHKGYCKLYPIVKELYRWCVREDGEDQSLMDEGEIGAIDLKNLVGFFNQSLYHEYLNITNIMKLKRLDFRDIYGIRPTDLILTRENMLERIMLLITSYFWMGTELRFLRQLGVEGFQNTIDAEYWHGKALEITVKFLPGDAPLTKHIVSSYAKHHSPSGEQIPEDEEVSSDLRVIKPFNGLDSNKLSPIIKRIDSPSVKLSPLDLSANDYIGNLIEKQEFHIIRTNENFWTKQSQANWDPYICSVNDDESIKKPSSKNTKELLWSNSSNCLINPELNTNPTPVNANPSSTEGCQKLMMDILKMKKRTQPINITEFPEEEEARKSAKVSTRVN
jgi:hypothetical protein